MVIIKKTELLISFLENQRKLKEKIGFVPTMGALHEGHLSLIQHSIKDCNLTVCSIFVNPTQFNNIEDFQTYPITIEKDIELLENAGCDVLFLPEKDEIYPVGFQKTHYTIGKIEQVLEGTHRPGHFQGVCMVVDQLLSIINCDHLYLGQKDYQQCLVIKKLIELKSIQTHLIVVDTVREPNGLAMSSRNKRLDDFQLKKSSVLFKSLTYAAQHIGQYPLSEVIEKAIAMIVHEGFAIDYFAICDKELEPISTFDINSSIVILVAASINGVRLIDNIVIS